MTAFACDQRVARLDVPMDEAALVGSIESGRELPNQIEGAPRVKQFLALEQRR